MQGRMMCLKTGFAASLETQGSLDILQNTRVYGSRYKTLRICEYTMRNMPSRAMDRLLIVAAGCRIEALT